MKPSFSELVEINELKRLCEIFSNLTGFATAILDMEGNVLVATDWQEICSEFHRKNPEATEKCRESDTALGEMPSPGEKYNVYRCRNGLIDVSVPIMIENEQAGRLYTGQFLFAPPDIDYFRRQAAEYGFDETSYLNAVHKVPIVSEEQVGQVMEFLCRLAEMIGRMGLGNRRLRETNEELRLHRHELERRVDGRTAEISAKNEQLRMEVDERKRAEEELRKSEEKYRAVADFTYDWETWLGPDGRFIYVSPSCGRISGYAAEEYINDPALITKIVHPDDRETVGRHLEEVLAGGIPFHKLDYRIINRNGGECWIEHYCQSVYGKDGNWLGQRASNRDITERKLAEERVNAALAEKEVLLKEVHHRVKNNLQIISTLLDLQADNIRDENLLNALKVSQDRIKAMSLIHERLYQSSDLVRIDFWEYIESLVGHLLSSYVDDPRRIVMKVDVGDFQMGIDRAIPCGLIINELVSNAMKHAFPNGRNGEIAIRLHADERGWITLTVADDGIGLPHGLVISKTETLGLQLVSMLAKQLRGQIEISCDRGTLWVISFSKLDNSKSAPA